MPFLLTLLSVLAVSLLSFLGIVLFFFEGKTMKRILFFFVSFSTGAMLGDVFMHMLPEIAEDAQPFHLSMLLVLGGILFSFVVEKFIRWRHCHIFPDQPCCDGHEHYHHHPVGLMSAIGDLMHNTIDGVIIAASFLTSTSIGISTTIAVVLHEIPHEIGNMAILLHSGYGKRRALFQNALSACAAIVGALATLMLAKEMTMTTSILLPFAAGNLLYIAGSDLIPELHKETGARRGFLQLLAILGGMALMWGMLGVE